MAMDSTPWLVGGGAEHTAETARLLAYVATGGAEGVAEPGDLKVTPLAVPGGGVRVAPGGVLVRNSNPGGGQQTYVARNPQTDTVSVQATGSSGGRADMIAVVVRDPQYPGTPVPSNPVTARYVDIEVIQGVPANARTAADAGLSYPVYPLARINLPASTGTVQAAHITDLRGLVSPKTSRDVVVTNVASEHARGPGDGSFYQVGPAVSVVIPAWATHVTLTHEASGVFCRHSQSTNVQGSSGYLRASFLGQNTHQTRWDMDINQGRVTRGSYTVARRFAIPAAMRGTTQPVQLFCTVEYSLTAFGVNSGTTFITNVAFEQGIV